MVPPLQLCSSLEAPSVGPAGPPPNLYIAMALRHGVCAVLVTTCHYPRARRRISNSECPGPLQLFVLNLNSLACAKQSIAIAYGRFQKATFFIIVMVELLGLNKRMQRQSFKHGDEAAVALVLYDLYDVNPNGSYPRARNCGRFHVRHCACEGSRSEAPRAASD